MTIKYKARVWEVGTVSGNGSVALPGVANTGAYRTVASAFVNGDVSTFSVADKTTNAWELSEYSFSNAVAGITLGSSITSAVASKNTTITVNATAAANSLLVIVISADTFSNTTPVTFSLPSATGLTFTQFKQVNYSSTNSQSSAIFGCYLTSAIASLPVTVTLTGSDDDSCIAAFSLVGVDPGQILDTYSSNPFSASGQNALSIGYSSTKVYTYTVALGVSINSSISSTPTGYSTIVNVLNTTGGNNEQLGIYGRANTSPISAENVNFATVSSANAMVVVFSAYIPTSAGSLSRTQFLESSTGSPVVFAGNSCDITCEIPSPILASAGTASAGLIPVLGANGLLDASVAPPLGGILSGIIGKQPTYPPTFTSSGFSTFQNQKSATLTNVSGGFTLQDTVSEGANNVIVTRAALTPPFTVTLGFYYFSGGTSCQIGMGFYDTSNGKFETIGIVQGGKAFYQQWTNFTTNSTSAALVTTYPNDRFLFLQVQNDGTTTMRFNISFDGVNFVLLQSFTQGFLSNYNTVCLLNNAYNAIAYQNVFYSSI